jgi:hypothetical protein
MANVDVFNDYDIVVSITQDAINRQLSELSQGGQLPSTLRIVRGVAGNAFTYELVQSEASIPRDAHGVPGSACIDATIQTAISIPKSGTIVTLLIRFTGGEAWLGESVGPLSSLTKYDATGWVFGIPINLDLAAIAKNDIGHSIVVPPLVEQQLTQFTSAGFDVSHLFLDLNSSNLMTSDPAVTLAPGANADGLTQFTEFMQFYLKSVAAGPNPFILGYVPAAQGSAAPSVPDVLKPVGATFTLFHDAANTSRSTVNFVLATKGGHGRIAGTPINFDSNWLPTSSHCDAVAVYSHSCLIEPLIVRPVFNQIRNDVFNQINGQIDNYGPGNDYDPARSIQPGPRWHFNICNSDNSDDLYQNNFDANFINRPDRLEIDFNGAILVRRTKHRNMLFCTAEAWGQVVQPWAGTVTLAVGTGQGGAPALQFDSNFSRPPPAQASDKNSCASAWDVIGDIFGGLFSALTLFTDPNLFQNLFRDAFSVNVNRIGDIGAVLQSLSSSAQTLVLLPTGTTFTVGTPSTDAPGNLSVLMNYATPQQAAIAVHALH